ncbi:MAG TPA: hypothetical protein DEF45_19715 [Rhodopirellula sp.]|nr:hypothetical protein [Rhodopirellula sp.]
MLRVKLVFRNGIHEGKHIVLRKEKFVIGRAAEADLLLNSKRVSRHHCLIWCRENSVTIQDLGSRNGVRLNGNVIEPHQSYQVYHDDIVDVEEWRFRMSVRDKASKVPQKRGKASKQTLLPTAEATDATSNKSTAAEPNEPMILNAVSDQMGDVDLWMKELDQLAEGVPGVREKIKSSVSDQRLADPMDTKEEPGSSDETLLDPVVTADGSGKADGTSGEVREAGPGETVETRETDTTEDDDEGVDGNQDKTPSKLPSHLRPKGPVDSVDAADQALKRLFGA